MTAAVIQKPGRFDALDTLRCLAVLVMVQGHTFYLVMNETVRGQYWYRWHNYLHGYTAPAFLFGAGLAFGVTTLGSSLQAHATPGPTLYKRIYRYMGLYAIGYALQLPPLHMDMTGTSAEALRVFFRVEALQHIATALLLCQALVVLLRNRLMVVLTTFALGAAIVLAGPYLSRLPFDATLPMGLASYLTTTTGSTFPLLPWVGFVFLGVSAAALLPVRNMSGPRGPSASMVWGLAAAGLALVAVSVGLDHTLRGVFGPHNYWKVSPYFFLRRMGWVVFALGSFAALDRYVASRMAGPAGGLRRAVRLMSQHSLIVYVVHLWVLYGAQFHAPRALLLNRLDVVQGSLLVLGLFASLLALLRVWSYLERNFDRPFLAVRRSSVAAMAVAVVFTFIQIPATPPVGHAPLAQKPAAPATPDDRPDGQAAAQAADATESQAAAVSTPVHVQAHPLQATAN